MVRMTRAYATGLVFIAAVAVIWALSSVLVQYLYSDSAFHSPFFVTYIGVSLFTLFLPAELLIAWLREHAPWRWRGSTAAAFDTIPMTTRADTEMGSNKTSYQNIPNDSQDDHDDNGDNDDHEPSSLLSLQQQQRQQQVPANLPWTNEQHIRAACYIAPVWFLANWTYNVSLAYTSITSSTVLASTGSLFTFLFAVTTNDENFSGLKLAGVCLGVAGSFLTTLQDTHSSSSSANSTNDNDATLQQPSESQQDSGARPLLGDIFGLVSAVGYGAYAVQTRLLCPHDESLYSMQRLLGYIGLTNLVFLSPVAIWQLLVSGVQVSPTVFGFLVVKGLFDNVLSDYLWLRSVILINATVATVGLGLTIPLAFASDIAMGRSQVLSAGTVMGAVTVLAGFVFVNIGNEEEPMHSEDVAAVTPPMHAVEETEDGEDNSGQQGMSLQDRQH